MLSIVGQAESIVFMSSYETVYILFLRCELQSGDWYANALTAGRKKMHKQHWVRAKSAGTDESPGKQMSSQSNYSKEYTRGGYDVSCGMAGVVFGLSLLNVKGDWLNHVLMSDLRKVQSVGFRFSVCCTGVQTLTYSLSGLCTWKKN